jgi:hypothetical protein
MDLSYRDRREINIIYEFLPQNTPSCGRGNSLSFYLFCIEKQGLAMRLGEEGVSADFCLLTDYRKAQISPIIVESNLPKLRLSPRNTQGESNIK